MHEPDELDYRILKFINSTNIATTADIVAKKLQLQKDVAQQRLLVLSRPTQYRTIAGRFTTPNPYSSYLHTTIEQKTFSITTFGKSALSNYLTVQRDSSIKRWEERFWKFAPMIISIISLLKSYNVI